MGLRDIVLGLSVSAICAANFYGAEITDKYRGNEPIGKIKEIGSKIFTDGPAILRYLQGKPVSKFPYKSNMPLIPIWQFGGIIGILGGIGYAADRKKAGKSS